jgi:hypothetical protein
MAAKADARLGWATKTLCLVLISALAFSIR